MTISRKACRDLLRALEAKIEIENGHDDHVVFLRLQNLSQTLCWSKRGYWRDGWYCRSQIVRQRRNREGRIQAFRNIVPQIRIRQIVLCKISEPGEGNCEYPLQKSDG